MGSKVRSTESQFCVRGSNQNVTCSGLSRNVSTEIPTLPSFGCPTTTSSTSASTETTIFTAEENVDTRPAFATTPEAQNETAVGTSNQGCCGPGLYALIVVIIVIFLILLVVIYLRCRRRSKLHAKYHTSSGNGPLASDTNKVEEANGTKIQNSAEAVPLKSHNWVGSTPNSSKPNIAQSQSAEPLSPSESASVVKTPSDPQLMVDEEPQVQDLQTQPSQVELLTNDEDLL